MQRLQHADLKHSPSLCPHGAAEEAALKAHQAASLLQARGQFWEVRRATGLTGGGLLYTK